MEHVLALSCGKDSLACIGAIMELQYPLDRIVHSEIWATNLIAGDPPPMVEFKQYADNIIKDRWGIVVEHIRGEKTYEDIFYQQRIRGKHTGDIHGFPLSRGSWCVDRLKQNVVHSVISRDDVLYLGIAADETSRFSTLDDHQVSPLVEIGWDEAKCMEWCVKNNLVSPIYTTATRGGCWFCHKQNVQQLRILRKTYPELWDLLLKWDVDSPVPFHSDGHTVHDLDKRFQLEDQGLVPSDRSFRWKMIETF